MALRIEKGTYGSYKRPCIYITDTDPETHYQEYAELQPMNDYAIEVLQKIFGRLEYCAKHNIPIEIDGFRTDKELYPNG